MTRYSQFVFLLAAFVAGLAGAAEPSTLNSLRAKFPHGIPWNVEILDPDGKSRGTLDMLITSDEASSCLGEMTDGVRVKFDRKNTVSPPLSIGSYGVATFDGGKIKIDLTGGVCDAYLVMSGAIASDGSSSGDIYTLNMGGGHAVGTYRATVK